MKFLDRLFLFAAIMQVGTLWAQPNITQAEYFFDTDPGFGNGIAISVTPGTNVTLTFTPSIAALADGFHNLYVRGKDANGNWSSVQVRSILKLASSGSPTISSFNPSSGLVGSTVVITGTNFSSIPGNNTVRFNGVVASVTAATSTSLTVTVPSGATTGLISVVVSGFTASSSSAFTILSPDITAIEYFFNTDPGPGNGTPISIAAGTTIDLTNINIPTTSLPVGWHTVHVRARDANNVWGFYESRQIYMRDLPPDDDDESIHDITQLEFFYNTDNGPGTGSSISITPGQNIDVVNTNLANTLPTGWHTMHVRAKNADNKWGFYESRQIYVREPPDPCCTPASPIEELEWFVDTDPGVGLSSTKKTINPALTDIDLIDEPLDVGVQTLGAHKIYVRAKNENGDWSMSEVANFTVASACPIQNAPSANGVARCDPGSVTLTASGASAGETYRWYASDTANTPLFTGNPYNTPSISVNTTYYVSAYNSTTFCESGRTPVTADISGIPKPVLNISGSLNVCEGITQLLSAPPGFASYAWSNGLTTQQITVSTSGSYSVTVNNGVCSSPASDAFVFTVNSKPAKPTLTASNGGSLCGVSFVTLNAPVGFSGYSWATGETTPSIDVTAVGSYSVSTINAAGCQSVSSDPISITSGTLSKPTIQVMGNLALCNGSTVTLTAPVGFSNYNWSNGETTQSITASAAENFSVSVGNGVCTSSSSDEVIVTELTQPVPPAIQLTGTLPLCTGAFAGLTAPSGYNHYLWSNGETSRQIIVSAANAGSFSVQVGEALHCLSASSDVTDVTSSGEACTTNEFQAPAPPSVNGSSICGVGVVTLVASGAATGLEYRWYDQPANGTLLASTASFTSNELSQTTDFFVSVFDPITLSESNRVKATATVIQFSKPMVSPNEISICEGSSTLLAAPGGFTNYQWRKEGNLIASTTQQISITEAGSYTVETGNGTCFGPSSDPVIVSVDSKPPKPSIAGNTTICESGTVTLRSTSGTQYLWSTNETTETVAVSAGTYFVTVAVGSCTSTSDSFTVNLVDAPAQPSISVVGKEVVCVGSLVALSAPDGFANYKWSTGATTQTLLVDEAGAYSVQTGNSPTCLSEISETKEVRMGTIAECGIVPTPSNRAPEIETASFAVQIQSEATHSLTSLISDDEANLDLSSLRIIDGPAHSGKASGGKATLDAEQNLLLDYRGLNFAGQEFITLQVCDVEGLCAQQQMTIDVVGEVLVYNGITPDGDGINDFMLIQFIDIIEGAKKNKVTIMNRWGDVIFEMDDYNNVDRVFAGTNQNGGALPSGTYLYKISLATGQAYTGFITLKR